MYEDKYKLVDFKIRNNLQNISLFTEYKTNINAGSHTTGVCTTWRKLANKFISCQKIP